jgi:hypothetical protein
MVCLLRKPVEPNEARLAALSLDHGTKLGRLGPSQEVNNVNRLSEWDDVLGFTSFTASAKFGTLVSLVTGSSVPG